MSGSFEKRTKLANNVMNYIYKYIDTNINIDELSSELNISKFHLHRIFRDEFGKNIYESIKSIRLEKAANLLITNNANRAKRNESKTAFQTTAFLCSSSSKLYSLMSGSEDNHEDHDFFYLKQKTCCRL